MNKRILFIAHDASRTGAPKVLLELLKRLSEETGFSFDVAFRKGGPLLKEFEKISKCYIWEKEYSAKSILRAIIVHQNFEKLLSNRIRKKVLNNVRNNHYQLVYANSAMSADVLLDITNNVKIPIIQHIHELEYMIQTFCDPVAFGKSVGRTTKFIAVSGIVKSNLIQNHGIKGKDIDLIHEFVPDEVGVIKNREQIRDELKLSEDDFVVVSSGTVDLRKGTDLFVQIARSCLETSKLKFVWVGGDLTSKEYFLFRQDIQKLRLEKDVIITGSVDNPYDYYNAADIFLMPSREDPFPLVCLEAAHLKKPIVCFEDAIGSTEFINNENGAVVPYFDMKAMTSEIIKMSEDSALVREKGEAIYKASSKYNLELAYDKIMKLLTSIVK